MTNKFPFYGWFGISLIAIFWSINWSLSGLRTQWAFFPLWLGFCLTIDAVVFYRSNTSLLTRSIKKYIVLFIASIPLWWLFEAFNAISKNWFYDGAQYFTNLQFFLLASLSFSVVVPAVFEAAELATTFKWINKIPGGPIIKPSPMTVNLLFALGITFLILQILFPGIFYFFTWLTLYFLIEPLNIKMRFKNLLQYTGKGNWKPVVALWCGCLICAFFWEMWNYYSYPKWIYDLPGVNYLHVFEMPLLGWLGYLPFSLEVLAMYHFISGLLKVKGDYLVID